ncbi:MAG TPA: hypothetical protein VKJ45_01055, partial [Blastocatellia bacterium]|nr:hypothetical protein [Blastocatellia bacterium]
MPKTSECDVLNSRIGASENRRPTWLFNCSLLLIVSAFLCHAALGDTKSGSTRLLRFPDISGNSIVFTYAGDLWSVSRSGGTARRLTSNPGSEDFPKYSPDGRWIAFTGDYDGNRDVYVIPAEGGEPRRLTYHPAP